MWTCQLILNTQILSLPVFCRLFDLPSLFAVIQEPLVTFSRRDSSPRHNPFKWLLGEK